MAQLGRLYSQVEYRLMVGSRLERCLFSSLLDFSLESANVVVSVDHNVEDDGHVVGEDDAERSSSNGDAGGPSEERRIVAS